MALLQPDNYKENGFLSGILGGGSNAIQNAITAAIDRGKQASNLMAGTEVNFQAQLNNSINRAVRKNEFDANRADRQDEFTHAAGQADDKLNESQRQFDVRMLFDDKKERADRADATTLLDLRKKEVGSMITARTAATGIAQDANRRANFTNGQEWILNNLKIAEAQGELADKADLREQLDKARQFEASLLEKSKPLFVEPPAGSAPGPLTVNPNATPEQAVSFVSEASKSQDPEVIGRAMVIMNSKALAGAVSPEQGFEAQFLMLDTAEREIKNADAALKDPKVRRTPKSTEQAADIITKFGNIIKNADPKVITAWRKSRSAKGGAATVAPTGMGQEVSDFYKNLRKPQPVN